MTTDLGVVLIICFGAGAIAGAIAYSKTNSVGAFFGFFIFGAILPLIGIIVACFVKGPTPPPRPPDWYPDPWQQGAVRYYDGREWTWHTAPVPSQR